MRIAELSRRSGVPTPTLKFYLREGLLPAGRRTAPNQADYDERHLRRVRLVRALVEVGRLGLGDVRRVVQAVEDEAVPIGRAIGIAHWALDAQRAALPGDEETDAALAEVDALLRRRRWQVSPASPARRVLADALVALARLGRPASQASLKPYADAADRLAQMEVELTRHEGSRAEAVEFAISGTVLYEAALVALRKLAHEHYSRARFPAD
jgi:DNA-binding transcriptional MerR regulator